MLFVLFSISKTSAQINLLQDYQNNYSADIGTFQGITFREAGFSGLYPIPNTDGKEFWTCSDRGVNIDAANANPAACRPTYDKIYAFPSYAPKIHRIRINGDSIQILQTITMKRPNGSNATGLLNPTGFGSTATELVSTDTVLNCNNFLLKIAAKDVWGIDAEGIGVDKAGNFWICEEGGASIWKLNQNGVAVKRYSPYANLPGAEPQDVLIDTVFKYRKNNRGFEGIAISPNGKVYAMIQSPVLYPTRSIGEATRIHRILEIDPANDSWKMYAYLNDGIVGASGANQIRLRDWKIGDIAAINDSSFLVLEAALRGTNNIKRLYKINIKNATVVSSGLYAGLTLEALVDAAGLAAKGITPVTKTLVMDLLANNWPASLEKAEGLAILNDSTIAIVNDNDYGQVSPAENGVATATGFTSHLLKYGLTGANKLSNFDFIGTTLSQGATAQNSSQTPYLTPTVPGVHFTSILTVGDGVNNYRMAGIPDGLGAYDNGNETFTLLMNHELGSNDGAVRAHGNKGAFVSKWIINKSDLSVASGADLIQNVHLWNPATSAYALYNAANPAPAGFGRFCSADLPAKSAFYNSATGKGTKELIFMNGEESGAEARAFGHIVTGPSSGTTYELPYLGKFSWENSVASPATNDKTVVAGLDDAGGGQVYFYIGNKTSTGTEVDKAGLNNGKLYGPVIYGFSTETDAVFPVAGTAFTMADLGFVQNKTGAALEAASNTAGVAKFLRPEDGAWDPNYPNDFYFVTTNGFINPSRLWKLHFTDINNLQIGGTVTVLLNGTEGQKMLDNMCFDNSGHIMMQEDVGNQTHIGKIWQYNTATAELKMIAQHDSTRFKPGGANYLTQDEESSGIIDVQNILGAGMFLSVVQAHYALPGELVQGGQLLAFYNPDTYNSNPEINLKGNDISITAGDITPALNDNTHFGNVNLGALQTKSYIIENTGTGALIVSNITLTGADKFTLVNIPSLPFTIAPNSSQTITVQFAPVALGLLTATLSISNNDFSEPLYQAALSGNGVCAAYITSITVNPNPTVPGQQHNTIYLGYGAQTVTLTAVANSFAPFTYNWLPLNAPGNIISVSPVTTTLYTVNVVNAYGCTSTASQTIIVTDIRDGNKNKVFICHNGHSQSVSVNAVAAHLAHGDELGNCANNVRSKIIDYTEAKDAVIYPNPSANEAAILLSFEKEEYSHLSVTDMNGKLVLPVIEKIFKAGNQRIVLNTSTLQNGTYFVRILKSSEIVNLKLVVLR